MLERARKELAEFYPPDHDGSVPVAYLWSRTVPCPNCDAEMPLIRQYWLARKSNKKVALQPVIDRSNNSVDFKVVGGPDAADNLAETTNRRGDTRCLLCGQVVKGAYVREAGRGGQMSATPTAVVLNANGKGGKNYRADTFEDARSYAAAAELLRILQAEHQGVLPIVPDEPIDQKTLGLRVDAFGLDQWSKLFNDRQLLALTTFARLVGETHTQMSMAGLEAEYAKAVATYFGLVVDRLADYNSTISPWENTREGVGHTFTRQALPMVWDYCEVNPFSGSTGSFDRALDWVAMTLDCAGGSAKVVQRDARKPAGTGFQALITDPPYYDAIDYSGLSDFFYVWLKRSVSFLDPDLLNLPLTPKKQQAIMASEQGDPVERQRYVSMMAQAFEAMSVSLETGGLTGVVFAHTHPDAWATLIEGLLGSGLVPDASWPIDTELQNKISAGSRANLKTSVWMACRKRDGEAGEAFLSDVMEEMRR